MSIVLSSYISFGPVKILLYKQQNFYILQLLILLMKNPLFLIPFILLLAGCEKTIEKIKEDAIIKIMTEGQWAITSFARNSSDITTSFTGYKFQYYSNKTVDAIKNGIVEKTGTWDGDGATMTTWANFTGATTPLNLINGSWHIDNSGLTYVEASQTITGEIKTMRLDKQ